ncbi:ComEA family DNA-binding protein [Halorhodospira halophila]|uniref:ComEA family DNA-binding protein n=1 Tax=Halorhodospira halophila TaxID=1053 RepID=UPI0019123DB2|nr:helix-hairpin-helix domain-containing protein [Halorhodospira halophila]MBK5942879.1 Fis family transcriptional regulator [Halorhodospira halophila]
MPEQLSGAIRASIPATLTALTLTAGAVQAAGGVDINEAGAEELAAGLTGVGEVRAAEIVEEREANGPFRDADDLSRVSGVGPANVEDNRERIRVEDAN